MTLRKPGKPVSVSFLQARCGSGKLPIPFHGHYNAMPASKVVSL
jgi:hypothetical protein